MRRTWNLFLFCLFLAAAAIETAHADGEGTPYVPLSQRKVKHQAGDASDVASSIVPETSEQVSAASMRNTRAPATTADAQKAILIASKQEFAGSQGMDGLKSWATDTPLCKFVGIQCNSAGLIDAISTACWFSTGTVYACPGFDNSTAPWVINGRLPASWFALTSVTKIVLDRFVNLSGTIPSIWSSLTNLQKLEIYPASHPLEEIKSFAGSISGSIPSTFTALTKLKSLRIDSQRLTGRLTGTTLQRMTRLETLSLSDNLLDGAVPSQVYNLRTLTYLDLSGNRFSGPVPATIGNLNKLLILDLSSNRFTGAFPTTGLARLTSITDLFMSNNNFTATSLPSQLSALTKVKSLGLAANNLRGSIPASWETGLKSLQWLDIHSNSISGNIFSSTSSAWKTLMELWVTDNAQLRGCLPSSVKFTLLMYNREGRQQTLIGANALTAGQGVLAGTGITGWCA